MMEIWFCHYAEKQKPDSNKIRHKMKAYMKEKQNIKFESVQPPQTNLFIKTQLFSYSFRLFSSGEKSETSMWIFNEHTFGDCRKELAPKIVESYFFYFGYYLSKLWLISIDLVSRTYSHPILYFYVKLEEMKNKFKQQQKNGIKNSRWYMQEIAM